MLAHTDAAAGRRDRARPPRVAGRGRLRARLARSTSEESLAAYWAAYCESDASRVRWTLAHPTRTMAASLAVLRLPVVSSALSDSPSGRRLRATLDARGPLGTRRSRTGVAVLDVPPDPQAYLEGPQRRMLRRRARSAERRGITWRPVDDPAERADLLERATRQEREHPDERYRTDGGDHTDLGDYDLWLVAELEGESLLLSVTPVDGDVALLRYFRTLATSPAHSDSRYLMSVALVAELARRGVRHLVDTEHPSDLRPGLQQFQRSVGFRLARVRPERPAHRVRPLHRGARAAGGA